MNIYHYRDNINYILMEVFIMFTQMEVLRFAVMYLALYATLFIGITYIAVMMIKNEIESKKLYKELGLK